MLLRKYAMIIIIYLVLRKGIFADIYLQITLIFQEELGTKKSSLRKGTIVMTNVYKQSPYVLLLLSLWQPFLALLPTHLSQILKTADFLPFSVSLSWSLYLNPIPQHPGMLSDYLLGIYVRQQVVSRVDCFCYFKDKDLYSKI